MTKQENTANYSANKRWTEDDDKRLQQMFSAGSEVATIAADLGRSESATEARLIRLDLLSYGPYNSVASITKILGQAEMPANTGKPWSKKEEARLLEVHEHTPFAANILDLADELHRSPKSLVFHLVKMGKVKLEINSSPNPDPIKYAASPNKQIKRQVVTKPTRKMKVTITPEFMTAYRTVEEGKNLLILGSAGTGKSTFLKWLRKKLGEEKNYVVLAPTGMAALQVGGQTLHSFFGFKPQLMDGTEKSWHKPRNAKIFKKLDLIIVDEISMVRADVFDSMDKFLRRYGPKKEAPFGGVQILALGDLFQLAPIVRGDEWEYFKQQFGTPFFFGSDAWKDGDFNAVEFTHIFRQSDAPFINLLNRVRHGDKSYDLLQSLNSRLVKEAPQGSVILAARNMTVERINRAELARLDEKSKIYKATTTGKVDENSFTSPMELELKVGARVMFTRNATNGDWVNGTLGEVIECADEFVKVKTDDGDTCFVEEVKWEIVKYAFDEETDAAVATVAGTFSQLPLTLAWALTIHKAQGQTLENCTVDLSDGGAFADGQLYVALSRARNLESLHLIEKITSRDVRTSRDVKQFYDFCFG